MPISPYLHDLRQKIGHAPVLMPAVSVMIFNANNEILLHRQRDDGLWHTIGGAMDPHEEPAAAARREAREETGLEMQIDRLSSVYAGPNTTYANGDQVMYVTLAFACRLPDNQSPRIADDESLEIQFFPLDHLPPLGPHDHQAILDAARNLPQTLFR